MGSPDKSLNFSTSSTMTEQLQVVEGVAERPQTQDLHKLTDDELL